MERALQIFPNLRHVMGNYPMGVKNAFAWCIPGACRKSPFPHATPRWSTTRVSKSIQSESIQHAANLPSVPPSLSDNLFTSTNHSTAAKTQLHRLPLKATFSPSPQFPIRIQLLLRSIESTPIHHKSSNMPAFIVPAMSASPRTRPNPTPRTSPRRPVLSAVAPAAAVAAALLVSFNTAQAIELPKLSLPSIDLPSVDLPSVGGRSDMPRDSSSGAFTDEEEGKVDDLMERMAAKQRKKAAAAAAARAGI